MTGPFLAALRFLTVIPLPGQTSESDFEKAPIWFAPAGLAMGLVVLIAGLFFEAMFPPALSSALLVALLIAVSGGLHMDGLADTADGFLSARPPERMLEIMRDSRVGTMGVLAVVLTVAIKVAALMSMPGQERLAAVFLMPVAGRAAILVLMRGLPYARPDGGLGDLFNKRTDNIGRGLAAGAAVLAASALLAFGAGGLLVALAAGLAAALFARYCLAKIGGYTGDTLGAACELAETAVAAAACSMAHLGW